MDRLIDPLRRVQGDFVKKIALLLVAAAIAATPAMAELKKRSRR